MLSKTLSCAAALSMALLLAPTPSAAADLELPIRISANVINMSNVSAGRSRNTRINILIERWSTEEERQILMDALKQGGRDSLPDALRTKERAGTIGQVSQLSELIQYSRLIPLDGGGHQILLATDRNIAIGEQVRGSRTLDHNVTLVLLELDAEGRGEGQLVYGAELVWDEANQRATITTFASEPLRLQNVRVR